MLPKCSGLSRYRCVISCLFLDPSHLYTGYTSILSDVATRLTSHLATQISSDGHCDGFQHTLGCKKHHQSLVLLDRLPAQHLKRAGPGHGLVSSSKVTER